MANIISFTSAGELLFTPNSFRGAFASEPSDPKDGWQYINTGDNNLYIYAGGIWWILQAVTPTGSVTYRVLLENSDVLSYEDGNLMRTE